MFTPPAPSLAVDQDSGRIYAAFQHDRLGDPDVGLGLVARAIVRRRIA